MKISLNTLPLSGKTAITLFLILLWYGYLLAALNTKLSVGLTAESIADHYSDHSLTKNEAKDIEQKGFSEEEVDVDNDHDHHNHNIHEQEGSADNAPAKERNGTITPQQIVQLGHIHMLGFSLLFVSLGLILSLTGIRELWKVIILLILFLSFGLDIGGLLLVRFVSPDLAILTFISGIGTGICMAVISLVALHDMWVRRKPVMERS